MPAAPARTALAAKAGGSSFLLPFTQLPRAAPAFGQRRGEVQLLSVTVGPHELGHLYSFVHRGRVASTSPASTTRSAEDVAGLLYAGAGHQHNAALGHQAFDLLGGAAMATHRGDAQHRRARAARLAAGTGDAPACPRAALAAPRRRRTRDWRVGLGWAASASACRWVGAGRRRLQRRRRRGDRRAQRNTQTMQASR